MVFDCWKIKNNKWITLFETVAFYIHRFTSIVAELIVGKVYWFPDNRWIQQYF